MTSPRQKRQAKPACSDVECTENFGHHRDRGDRRETLDVVDDPLVVPACRGRECLLVSDVDVRSASVKGWIPAIRGRQTLAYLHPADRLVTEQLDQRGHVMIAVVLVVEAVCRIVRVQHGQASVAGAHGACGLARLAEYHFALDLLLAIREVGFVLY